ncbi:hypothetical protein OO013_20035 [Mangrovivirga sp. M17]|uniref:SMODS and SLOG-associating 2TM effector domain-containing protein n=1 Tax=Mangrovivirga halotolerans TaxID=2993936 RepID=A0ABT3RWM5_9BACT|nr:hypothetical protein [Mangrovivirga halotolerans]MCX2746179.1 hypothetical protein [Mangrovivirga halotolerans]
MRIFPYKNIELQSPLTKGEVIDKLSSSIAYKERLNLSGIRRNSSLDYEGYISNDKLIFRRILKQGANSFIPQITGLFLESNNGTIIQLSARLHRIIQGFIMGFNSFLLLLFIIAIININTSIEYDFYISFLSLIIFMLIISNVLTRIIFNYELYRMEKDFIKILECTNKRPNNDNKINQIIENYI